MNWFHWERADQDDYEIHVVYIGLGYEEELLLTVCDSEIVGRTCPAEEDRVYENLCPYLDDIPQKEQDEYPTGHMEQYLIDNLYTQAFEDHWFPFCRLEINEDGHYPEYWGCFFLEGYRIKVIQLMPLECDASQ
jgi:hypothetical protein